MLIHNKDDIEFVTESHVYWDTLYKRTHINIFQSINDVKP